MQQFGFKSSGLSLYVVTINVIAIKSKQQNQQNLAKVQAEPTPKNWQRFLAKQDHCDSEAVLCQYFYLKGQPLYHKKL